MKWAHNNKLHQLQCFLHEYKWHIEGVLLDRIIDGRIAAMSREAFIKLLVLPVHSVASVCYDAMDQSKFRVPRGAPNAKALEACWKPQLHMVGCIIDGHVQAYYVCDSTMPKDSSN